MTRIPGVFQIGVTTRLPRPGLDLAVGGAVVAARPVRVADVRRAHDGVRFPLLTHATTEATRIPNREQTFRRANGNFSSSQCRQTRWDGIFVFLK